MQLSALPTMFFTSPEPMGMIKLSAMETNIDEASQVALPRTYAIKTLGCQMNVHDSERMAGLLEEAGLIPVDRVPAAQARATDAG